MTKKKTPPKANRRRFTSEFKSEVVELIRTSGRSIGSVSRELDLSDSAVREWLRQAEARERPKSAGPEQDLQAELRAAKKRIKELEMEKEILKKAAALFAREDS